MIDGRPYFYLPVNLPLSKISLRRTRDRFNQKFVARQVLLAQIHFPIERDAHKPASKRITRVIIKLIESFIDNQFEIAQRYPLPTGRAITSASKVSAKSCRYFIDRFSRCSLFFSSKKMSFLFSCKSNLHQISNT